MEKIKEFSSNEKSIYVKAISIALVILIAFSSGYASGLITNIKTDGFTFTNSQAQGSSSAENALPVQATQQTVTEQSTTASVPTASAQTAAPSEGTPSTPEEIVALFNKSADGVKANASKVVKNFEKRSSQPEKTVVPSALQGTANSLMEQFMKDDTEPIEYATKEDIAANYPVPGQSYSSKLTVADVKEATCNDLGSEYEITLKLNDSINPTAGVGVGAACDVIESEDVTSNGAVAAIMKEFSLNYYDCVIKCKIDKASGNLTWASYTTPLIIDCKVSVVISTVDATVGLTFEKDYSITY